MSLEVILFLKISRIKNKNIFLNILFLKIGNDLINKPEKAAFPSVAFKLAAWFWNQNAYVIKSNLTSSKGDLNELADGTFSNPFFYVIISEK